MLYPKRTRGAIGDNWAIGGVAIVIILVCLYFIFIHGGGGNPTPKGPWYFKCWKPASEGGGCGFEKEVTDFDEYKAMLPQPDPNDIKAGPMDVVKMECPGCKAMSLYQAEKCPDHGIYVPSINVNPYHERASDVCTDPSGCTYSPSAERAKKWREEHGK